MLTPARDSPIGTTQQAAQASTAAPADARADQARRVSRPADFCSVFTIKGAIRSRGWQDQTRSHYGIKVFIDVHVP